MILDLLENFTSIHYNGCSVADYTLVSSNLLNSIRHIKVHELSSLSDHFPIMRSIIAAISNTSFTENIKLDPLPWKYLWNADSIDAYSENVSSPDVRKRFQNFETQEFNDPDTAATAFNELVLDVARSSTKYVKNISNMQGRRKKHKPSFSQSCEDLRNIFKKRNTCKENPANGSYRHAFYSCRSKFRRMCHYDVISIFTTPYALNSV